MKWTSIHRLHIFHLVWSPLRAGASLKNSKVMWSTNLLWFMFAIKWNLCTNTQKIKKKKTHFKISESLEQSNYLHICRVRIYFHINKDKVISFAASILVSASCRTSLTPLSLISTNEWIVYHPKKSSFYQKSSFAVYIYISNI